LKYNIDKNGDNLSVGQKQLICIARALLKKAKILLMDEATANIDRNMDQVLQGLVNNELKDVTILTISHNVEKVANYDKIAVLEDGAIVEYGSHNELLRRKGYYWKIFTENKIG